MGQGHRVKSAARGVGGVHRSAHQMVVAQHQIAPVTCPCPWSASNPDRTRTHRSLDAGMSGRGHTQAAAMGEAALRRGCRPLALALVTKASTRSCSVAAGATTLAAAVEVGCLRVAPRPRRVQQARCAYDGVWRPFVGAATAGMHRHWELKGSTISCLPTLSRPSTPLLVHPGRQPPQAALPVGQRVRGRKGGPVASDASAPLQVQHWTPDWQVTESAS